MLKDEEIYNIFNTEKILNRPVSVCISDTSGIAGIAYWYNSYYALKNDDRIDKKDPLILAIKEKVDIEYKNGRQTVMSDDEIVSIISEIKGEAE